MSVMEVKNSEFIAKEFLKRRKRKRVRKSVIDAEFNSAKIEKIDGERKKAFCISSEQEVGPIHIHKAYRDFLVQRKNGERNASLNYFK